MRLTERRLNRATLARQMLLRRESADVMTAVSRLGGLQAQEPASPYLALWTRLADLDADVVTAAVMARQLVKATLQRSTLHLVAAADYLASETALTVVRRTKWMNEARGLPVKRSLQDLTESSLRFASRPRTNIEMRDYAGTLGEPVAADELWRRIRRHGAFIQVPVEAPWAFSRRPSHVAADTWLEGPRFGDEEGLEHLVRSHLAAFGPSRLADIAQWSGLAVSRLRIGLDRITDLERHEDDRGRQLFDLAGAPLPDADTPAPPRLLPMWDESLLAYQDRSRVLPDIYRARVIAKNGDVLPTILVDGSVVGLWWAEIGHDGRSEISLEPFEPLSSEAQQALEGEARGLARFIAAREPTVYARYRRSASPA